MFSKKSAGVQKPVIRKETVQVKVEQRRPNPSAPPPHSARPPTNRFKLSTNSKVSHVVTKRVKQGTPEPARRAIEASRGKKRKSATPDLKPNFSDDEDDDSSDVGASDSDASQRKKAKSSVSSVDSKVGPRRPFVDKSAFDADREPEELSIVHGLGATSGEHASKFRNPWDQDYTLKVELQYPTNSKREHFELKWPKNEKDDYRPMEDITETIDLICKQYFPPDLCEQYTNPESGLQRRFARAFARQSQEDFCAVVDDFNEVMSRLVRDGTAQRQLASKRRLPLELVARITTQIYGRTVSPKVETLRAYKNGSDNVYGELLPRFCSKIFHQVDLTHDQVFVDLGSGVGNVVLQAALEVGCESHGIEMMKNPCDLAAVQAQEFPGRAKLWGVSCGSVALERGDFTNHPGLTALLARADVVLVNNQAFTPQLNATLLSLFLDLKQGAKVVSLKPFVPEDHRFSTRTLGDMVNLFRQEKFEYFSGYVSWTDQAGNYYIAEKDSRPLERYMRVNGLS